MKRSILANQITIHGKMLKFVPYLTASAPSSNIYTKQLPAHRMAIIFNICTNHLESSWIKGAYGQKSLKEISSKPVICSGSTMGSQRAIELYSVAMVAQFDTTKCK